MADNTLTKIGDSVVFTTIPIFNLQTLTSYTPTFTGITGTRTLQTQFCFSLDGVVYTEWKAIATIIADINAELPAQQTLFVRFMFTRTGTDTTGNIVIVSLDLNGTYIDNSGNYPVGLKSHFKDLVYDNVDVYTNAVNLVQKIYAEGILPTYIERGEVPNDLHNDEDFIAFWSAIAQFLSIFYIDSLKFSIAYWRFDLLSEWLTQKNVIFAPESNMQLLQHLAKNYFDEMRQRGTIEIFREKDYQYPMGNRNYYTLPTGFVIQPSNPIIINDQLYNEVVNLPFGWTLDGLTLYAPDLNYYRVQYVDWAGSPPVITGYFDYSVIYGKDRVTLLPAGAIIPTLESGVYKRYDGEFLRLIAYDVTLDEFMFLIRQPQHRGWNIGNCSPLYRGLRQVNNNTIIKGYENYSEEVYDLDRYPIDGATLKPKAPYAPYSMQQYLVPAPATTIGGISIVSELCPPYPYSMKQAMRILSGNGFGYIDTPTSRGWMMRIDPTVTYEVSFYFKQSVDTPSIDLSVSTFNAYMVAITTYNFSGGTPETKFLDGATDVASNDITRWYFAQYFIYGTGEATLPSGTPALCPLNVGNNLQFDPRAANMLINLNATEDIDIFNFKVKPAKTPYSTGFVQNGNMLEVWRKNNNNKYNEEKIDAIAKNFLINYNLALATITLPIA